MLAIAYPSGFGNEFATAALKTALPIDATRRSAVPTMGSAPARIVHGAALPVADQH